MRCRLYLIFISSLGDLFSLPPLTTLKVKNVGMNAVYGSAVTSAAATGSNSDLFPPDTEGVFGRVPQSILDDESSHLITTHENSLDLQNLHRVSENAYKQYLKSRPNPSTESIRRVKSTDPSSMAVHPLLGQPRVVNTTVARTHCQQLLVTR